MTNNEPIVLDVEYLNNKVKIILDRNNYKDVENIRIYDQQVPLSNAEALSSAKIYFSGDLKSLGYDSDENFIPAIANYPNYEVYRLVYVNAICGNASIPINKNARGF